MPTATLRKSGGSTIVALPKPLLDHLGLAADAVVEVGLEGDAITIRARRRYKLADLLAQCDFSAPMTVEEREWLDAPAVGEEWGSPEWGKGKRKR